jgi:hypothetical protein
MLGGFYKSVLNEIVKSLIQVIIFASSLLTAVINLSLWTSFDRIRIIIL